MAQMAYVDARAELKWNRNPFDLPTQKYNSISRTGEGESGEKKPAASHRLLTDFM